MKEPFDSILSNKAKKNKKNAESKMYFDNTHDVLGLYKNPSLQTKEEEEEGDGEKGRPKGMALLKRIYGGAVPVNPSLYSKAKQIADKTYSKPSAYKSGFIQKKYKEMGGEYKDDGDRPLERWYKEDWKDIGNKDYPVYRPTKRVSKKTPLTASEIDPKQAVKQIALKQKIKGKRNLPPFKGGGQIFSFASAPEFTQMAEHATTQQEIDNIYRNIRRWATSQGLQVQDFTIQLIRRGMVNAIQQNNLNANRQGANRLQPRDLAWEIQDITPVPPKPFSPPNQPKKRGGCKTSCKTSCKGKLKQALNRAVDNYSDVVNHLEEHLQEKAGDPLDAKQSKYLKSEIKRINEQHLTPANRVAGDDPLYKVSNPREVQKKAFEIYGKDAIVYKSDKPKKKYQILDKNTGKWVYFGDAKMEDFEKHRDAIRQHSYLSRALGIKGKWRENPYSPNTLAIMLLW